MPRAKKSEVVNEEPKKAVETEVKAEPKKSAAKKSTAKKAAESKEDVFVIQSRGVDYTIADIKEMCIKAYKGDTRKRVKNIDIYVNCDNDGAKAYYVVNGNAEGAYIEL